MNIFKLIAIYSTLFAVIVFAHTSEFANVLYFMAALFGMTLLNSKHNSEEDMEAAASH